MTVLPPRKIPGTVLLRPHYILGPPTAPRPGMTADLRTNPKAPRSSGAGPRPAAAARAQRERAGKAAGARAGVGAEPLGSLARSGRRTGTSTCGQVPTTDLAGCVLELPRFRG